MKKSIFRLITAAFSLLAAVCAGHSQAASAERQMKFTAKTPEQALAWQKQARNKIFQLLKLDDLVAASRSESGAQAKIPLNAKILDSKQEEKYTRFDLEINSTNTRRLQVVLTIPRSKKAKLPAVICIHGHGGNRNIVYQDASPYRGFARFLAEDGYVTISTDVGQHNVYETGRTLMGERLWDLIRCLEYLNTRAEVDPERIGCAGLSLGGEMAMWLGAMDTRIQATVSAGFLTTVENMRHGHCPCWDFPGFTENFDFADIYSLMAPRPLQCQIGELERAPGGFPVSIAEKALAEIKVSYGVFGKAPRADLVVHPAGHIFDVPPALKLLDEVLRKPAISPQK